MSNTAASPMSNVASSSSGRGLGRSTSFTPELQSMIPNKRKKLKTLNRLCGVCGGDEFTSSACHLDSHKPGLSYTVGSPPPDGDENKENVFQITAEGGRAMTEGVRFSLGDARRPLHETAVLVEDIIHTQLINLLQQAAEVSQLRGARVISAEDLLFLMRKDKKKLRRLLKYMFFRDYKSKIIKGIEEDDLLEDKFNSSSVNKRQKLAQDFLNSIDQTGELLAMFEDDEIDDVKQERMERAERQTRMMDSAQYAEFCESRQLSFSKKASKFRDWLDCSSMEIKPNAVAMEILAYLAYETVAQLVDLALLVKQDMTPKAGDPFSHAISATFIQYHNSVEPHLLGQATSMKSSLDSPESTPPPTPTPPTSSGPQHLGKTQSGAMGNGSIGQDSTKVKQRKRKKSTAACGIEAQSDAIQPCHIREAIRRYGHKIGPLSPFTSAYRRNGMTFLAC